MMLVKENKALREKVRRLEIFLSRSDEQFNHLQEKVKKASLTIDNIIKEKAYLALLMMS